MNRRKLMLTLFLASPLVLLGAILLGIKYLRPAMNAPPVGAGAGDTGGANAIGELMDHGTTTPKKVEPVRAAQLPTQLGYPSAGGHILP